MKRLYSIVGLLVISTSCFCQSPNWNEWMRQKKTQRKYLLQQIAALEAYYNYLKKGYEICDKGLTMIGDIKDGKLTLDKKYLNALSNVSPAVRNSPKLAAITDDHYNMLRSLRKLVDDCRDNPLYTAEGVQYIESVSHN